MKKLSGGIREDVAEAARMAAASGRVAAATPAIDVRGVSRRFGDKQALHEVSLTLRRGSVHALLGPNGAGKTTLLRILAGLVDPDGGSVVIDGDLSLLSTSIAYRTKIRMTPSGERSFYMRISGIENLVFFGRLYGLRTKQAKARARECFAAVGLEHAGDLRVGRYSHGMQKRLSVARALLVPTPIVLIDEATHDLDPQGSARIRGLIRDSVDSGTAVLWATQRLDEIRGFADHVTLLNRGRVRFDGNVPAFMATSPLHRYLIHLRDLSARGPESGVLHRAQRALGGIGKVLPTPDIDTGHVLMLLDEGATLGRALRALMAADLDVLACREERSDIEEAFLSLTDQED
jgi:ABC-2 type transport system ATP-binding protein